MEHKNMTYIEALEKLRAYHKCKILQVKGIYEDCNNKLCDNCDLCYAQGNVGEHIKSIEIAIQAIEKHIQMKPDLRNDKNMEKIRENMSDQDIILNMLEIVNYLSRQDGDMNQIDVNIKNLNMHFEVRMDNSENNLL